MGQLLFELLESWAGGALTTLEPDALPPGASPRMWNTELVAAGGDQAKVRKRRGLSALLSEPLTDAPVVGQTAFRPLVNGAFTPYHVAVTNDGQLFVTSDGASTSLIDTLAVDTTPVFAQAQNLCFVVNGTDKVKVTTAGDAVQLFGIVRPAAAPVIASSGSGVMSGTYDVALTYYNSVTGHESSRSDHASLTLANQRIQVVIPEPPDPQVDIVRVHIRKQSLNAYFFRVIDPQYTPPPDPTTGSLPDLVTDLNASGAAGTITADFGAQIGYSDGDVLQAYYNTHGTVPTDYAGLAAIIGYGDLDALLANQTAPPAPEASEFDATHGGWPITSGGVTLNLSDAVLNALIILSPDTSENDPPPDGVKYFCWHQSRMFAADDDTLLYSKLAKPEAFDPDFFEQVNPNDGQRITGLASIGGILVIFKSRSIWGLFGDDPNSWYLRNIDPDTGCTAHSSIVTVDGRSYWWSEQGPWMWAEGQQPFPVGKELLRPSLEPDQLNYLAFDRVVAAADRVYQRVVFAVPEAAEDRNTILLPYSYRLQRWEATKWDPMDTCSFAAMSDEAGVPYICLGNYAGELFRLSDGEHDGVAAGTRMGSFVASATSLDTLTDATAEFSAPLAERRVTVVDSNGVYVGRRRITANASTTLTLATSLTGLTVGTTYYYYIGGPDFQFDTRWGTFDLPFHKKRFEFLFLEAAAATGTALACDLRFDFNPTFGQSRLVTLTGASTTWDATVWTAAAYDTATRVAHRLRVGRTGRVWQVRLRQPAPDTPVTLHKLGMQAERLTTKR